MELLIKLKERDLGDYIDYHFTVYRDGKEITSIWTGEPQEYWETITNMIGAYVKEFLNHAKPRRN
jgi:hypothetical protein